LWCGFPNRGERDQRADAKNFANITDVKIVDVGGAVLVRGELISTFVVPRNVAGGVKSSVL
jgi:hypothetical protein